VNEEQTRTLMALFPGGTLDVLKTFGGHDRVAHLARADALRAFAPDIRRAQAVKDYLVKLGIPSDRIFIDGKGATQPVASNKTSQGRARNRRVDVEVIGTKAP
jgi:OOP family OmpA-OmpF porin